MQMPENVDEKYVTIAIQTVLQRNRNLIHLFMDTEKYLPFIKDLSREILLTARTYQDITEHTNDIAEDSIKTHA
ncbi:MAG TPA: hypothetical protein VGE40_00165 [Bacilli bacterium]